MNLRAIYALAFASKTRGSSPIPRKSRFYWILLEIDFRGLVSPHCLDAANLLEGKMGSCETRVWHDLRCGRPEIGRKTLFVVNVEPVSFLHILPPPVLISFPHPAFIPIKNPFLILLLVENHPYLLKNATARQVLLFS